MVSVKVMAFAGVAGAAGNRGARRRHASDDAADAMPYYEEFARGWYLRGDIGMSNQKRRQPVQRAVRHGRQRRERAQGFRQRADLRSRHRLPVQQLAARRRHRRISRQGELPRLRHRHMPAATRFTDEYRASKSEWLVLANVYADLGTWGAFTPFVGVGIGGSRNTISNFMDVCTTCPGGGVAHGGDGVEVQLRLGGRTPASPTRSRTTSRSSSPIATSISAMRSAAISSPISAEQRQQPDALPQHHLARLQVRRALDARLRAPKYEPMPHHYPAARCVGAEQGHRHARVQGACHRGGSAASR